MKKTLRETQTLRAGCSKKDPNIFAPPQTPFPGGAERPKFNQLAGDGHYLYIHRLQTQFGEDRCTQFRVIVLTEPQTNKQTNTNGQDRLLYTAPLILARGVTGCAGSREICPRPCTPLAAAQLQPIHALRLRRPARLGL